MALVSVPLVVSPSAEEDAAIVRAVVRAVDLWGLSNREASVLFDVPIATWNRMKAGLFRGRLDQDKRTRASLIIGIFKGLRLFFNGPLTYGWLKMPNSGPLFQSRPPLEFMLAGGIPALLKVRRTIDAMRGGL
nr:antitoxin Xre-like helix-turn-helix domain-containing protein [uncultured Gellertiella sp.]